MEAWLTWLQSSGLGRSVGESIALTSWLSATHLVGFTLAMSGALVWNLRTCGLLLGEVPLRSIVLPGRRLLIAGLAISALTGLALFAPRATTTASSGAFQLKIGLAGTATLYQLALAHKALSVSARPWLRWSGAAGLVLWLSLALAACWFILFE